MTIVTNIHRELCALSKAGGIPIDYEVFLECVQLAMNKSRQLTELVQSVISNKENKQNND